MTAKGFTLIELLVTITIIALISAIGLTTYSSAQIVARDGRRKQDLKNLQTSFELFYHRHGTYPSYNTGTLGDSHAGPGCTPPSHWPELFQWDYTAGGNPVLNSSEQVSDYISSTPTDPSNNCQLHYNYYPTPISGFTPTNGPGAGQGYYLCASLENTHDPDYNNNAFAVLIGHNYCVRSPTN